MKGAILYKPVLTNVGLVNKPPIFCPVLQNKAFWDVAKGLDPKPCLGVALCKRVESAIKCQFGTKRQLSVGFFHQEANKAGSKSHSCKNKELWDFQMCSLDQIPTVPARSRLRQLLLPHHNNKTHLFQQLGGRGRLAPLAPSQGSRSDFSY